MRETASPNDGSDNEGRNDLSRKRKRDTTQASELEIDVSLPEPPSKKALRKAKKQKVDGQSTKNSIQSGNGASNTAREPKSSRSPSTDEPTHSGIASSKSKPAPGVWIGNLPFAVTKALLRKFLTQTGSILDASITRIHIPAPHDAKSTQTTLKPKNKGFAYVDFDSPEAQKAAIGLSETKMGERSLLIKDSKSFVGRPEERVKPKEDSSPQKHASPTKRVFVGNLGFDVTKDDLVRHFGQCGELENVHMASFEDSGKCKGYAWITFANVEAAQAAVRGWTLVPLPGQADDVNVEKAETEGGGRAAASEASESRKSKRKWFVNRLFGRQLRCEYAEDGATRYKKRFGSAAKNKPENGDDTIREAHSVPGGSNRRVNGHDRTSRRLSSNRTKPGSEADEKSAKSGPPSKKDWSSVKAYSHGGESGYRTGNVTVKPQGKKTIFGD